MSDESNVDPLVTVFSGGHRFLVGRSAKHSTSYFGGPGYDRAIDGPRYGPRRIHHILTLNHNAFEINSLKFGLKTSFYYGLCFEGCELEWERTHSAAIRITRIVPRKSGREYPYFGYPDVLPYFPLEVQSKSTITLGDVRDAIYNTGWNADLNNVYVIVHSHPDLGIALLDPDGDVDLAFELVTETGRIRAVSRAL